MATNQYELDRIARVEARKNKKAKKSAAKQVAPPVVLTDRQQAQKDIDDYRNNTPTKTDTRSFQTLKGFEVPKKTSKKAKVALTGAEKAVKELRDAPTGYLKTKYRKKP